MRVEIVTVGTELLLGDIVDTNSAWLAQRLAENGIDVHFQTKVGDNLNRMVEAFSLALSRADAVVVTGGLGPTQDDITREAIAEVMGTRLHSIPELEERIAAIFRVRTRGMTQNNLRQAEVPEGASWIDQRVGTAPGLICPVDRGVIYAIPGVPHEMEEMFNRAILPDLHSRSGKRSVIVSRTIKTWGVGESVIADMIRTRVDAQSNPTIAFLAGDGAIKVRLTAKAETREEARRVIDEEEVEVRAILGDLVFGIDEDTLAASLGSFLALRGWKIAIAESLTGGMVGSAIVDIPGASDWFAGSAVTYSSRAKISILGVDPVTIETHGAVSAECAREMAEGARRVFSAEIGLACTGEAGPVPAESEVGDVYLAFSGPDSSRTIGVRLPGDRQRIRLYSTASLLDFGRRMLADTGD